MEKTEQGVTSYFRGVAKLRGESDSALVLDAMITVMHEVSNTFGCEFYNSIIQSMAGIIAADYTFIGRFDTSYTRARTLALCSGTDLVDNFEYELSGTPCAKVAEESTCIYPNHVCDRFPLDQLLVDMNVQGYIGAPLLNRQHQVIGLVVALYKDEIKRPDFVSGIFELFAGRIAAEIENTEATDTLDELNRTLEAKVLQRTEALTQVNDELKSFSYSLSHDLREPLRAMSCLMSILRDKYIIQLPEKALAYFDDVDNACSHMSGIIEDMLKLSKLSEQALNLAPVDVTALSWEIVERLRQSNPNRKVAVDIDSGISLFSDLSLIKILLENLIGNAWKYTSKLKHAKISIKHENQELFTNLIILDNGAGFAMKEAEDIFQPFNRLHSGSEFQGSGVGLSTVKRVVDRHNAKISIESAVNCGAQVTIKWPRFQLDDESLKVLEVLVIEDNTIDFMLVCRLIKNAFGDVPIHRAKNKAECEFFLQKPWVLIISDCHIEDAEAPEIVKWIMAANCNNFLLLSGSPEEYQQTQFEQEPLALMDKSDTKGIGYLLAQISGR